MKRALALALICACAAQPAKIPVDPAPPVAPVTPPAPVVVPTAPPQAPKLDEATVKAKSHEFFDALDRFDVAAFSAAVAPSFISFGDARYGDAASVEKSLQGAIEHHAAVRSRTLDDEHVYIGPTSVVFIAHVIQHFPAETGGAAYDRDVYSSLVWVPVDGTWKVVYSDWQRWGLEIQRIRWNDTLQSNTLFKKEPNQLLVDTVKGKKPGTALDFEMGQGRNALYLASQGWKVTGVDFSDEGIKMAKAEAAKRKLKLDTIQADTNHWDPGKDKWDLVTMIYAGDSADTVRRLQPSIKKGGLFVLEYFSAESDMKKFGAGGWARGDLAKLFADGWEILRDDTVEDISDWGLTKRALQRFVARKK